MRLHPCSFPLFSGLFFVRIEFSLFSRKDGVIVLHEKKMFFQVPSDAAICYFQFPTLTLGKWKSNIRFPSSFFSRKKKRVSLFLSKFYQKFYEYSLQNMNYITRKVNWQESILIVQAPIFSIMHCLTFKAESSQISIPQLQMQYCTRLAVDTHKSLCLL